MTKKEWCLKRKADGRCGRCNGFICEQSTYLCEMCLLKCRERNRLNAHKYKWCDRKKPDPLKVRFTSMKQRAKRGKLAFLLSQEEFITWFNSQEKCCCYCGATEQMMSKSGRKKVSLTVDRKDNGTGYQIDNICLACHRCNKEKSDFFTEAQWMDIATKFIRPRLSAWLGI